MSAVVSDVERHLLESVRHTGAASMLASLSSSQALPSTGDAAGTPASGVAMPDGGQDRTLCLTDALPGGQPSAAKSSRISKTATAATPGPFYPIDCWERFAAYPLRKDGAGRVRVFDAPTTKRGMVRAHNSPIADLAFTCVHGQTLLAATSVDGRVSISHVVPPVAADTASDLAVHVAVCLQLGEGLAPGAWVPEHGGEPGREFRPLVAWRPGCAEILVATEATVLHVDVLAVMTRQRAQEGGPLETVMPDAFPGGVRKHCEIDERVTALAVHPDGTEVALCGDQGAVHVYPLPPLDSAAPHADNTATSFRSAQARDGIVFAAYLAAGGGRPALVTAAEAADAALCVRIWAVDRSQADAARQVACKDSVRLTPGAAAAGGGPGHWAISAHGTQPVVMCGHEGAPGRVCTVAVGAAQTFAFYQPFLLGRDSSGVRALRIDGTSGMATGDLHAIAVDGACFDRLSLPWAHVRPASVVSGDGADGNGTAGVDSATASAAGSAAATASTVVPAAAAAADNDAARAPTAAAVEQTEDPQPTEASDPEDLAAAAAAPAEAPPPLPRVSSSASQRLLVPGALQRGGSVSGRGSVASDTHAATPPRGSVGSELLVPAALSNASTPGASSVHNLVRHTSVAAAAAAPVAAPHASGALPQGPQASRSVGLDMLETLFAEPLPAAQTETAPAQPTAASAAAIKPPGSTDGAAAPLDRAADGEAAASGGLEAGDAVSTLTQAAAAAASAAQRALGFGASTPTPSPADDAPADATGGSGKKRRGGKARDKPKGGDMSANGAAERDSDSASSAQLAALADSLDKLQKEVQGVKAAAKANSEQVAAALKRLEKNQDKASTALGQMPGRLTAIGKDVHAAVSKDLDASLGAALAPQVTAAVDGAFAAAFERAVVPAFERAMQAMFQQVNAAFNAGMAEQSAASRAAVAALSQDVQSSVVAPLAHIEAAAAALSAATRPPPQPPQRAAAATDRAHALTQGLPNLPAIATLPRSAAPPPQPPQPQPQPPPPPPQQQAAGVLAERFADALARQAPEERLVPLCLAAAPATARSLSDEFRVCIAQQLVTVLPAAQRPEAHTEALVGWAAECLRDVRAVGNADFRVTYIDVLEQAGAAVKAIRNGARYRSGLDVAAAALGTLVMERQASLL